MEDKYKRISRIENFLSMLLAKSKASKHFFVNNLPQEIEKEWTDMIYAEVNSQNDREAYSTGTANIYLYTKPTGTYNRKDLKAMDKMEAAMDETIKDICDPHYVVQVNWRDSDYDKDLQFYFNVINISIFVR